MPIGIPSLYISDLLSDLCVFAPLRETDFLSPIHEESGLRARISAEAT